jgi:hypothetical protein
MVVDRQLADVREQLAEVKCVMLVRVKEEVGPRKSKKGPECIPLNHLIAVPERANNQNFGFQSLDQVTGLMFFTTRGSFTHPTKHWSGQSDLSSEIGFIPRLVAGA